MTLDVKAIFGSPAVTKGMNAFFPEALNLANRSSIAVIHSAFLRDEFRGL
jgi:hypothetical protein